jgi:acyl transferase domain-containing protein/short-subunit dehydrogenase/acyl carrier protein
MSAASSLNEGVLVHPHSVAIIGIGCRLPGGIDEPENLVTFLERHGDAVGDVPADRWSADLHYHADETAVGKAYVKRGAFLNTDVFAFDPEPFGISPREADFLDPQQRLLLEVSWEAFEDAGIPADCLRGSATSVFIGGFTLDHQTLAYSRHNRPLVNSHTSVGASMTMLSNRISYTFDLRGPSMTIDTACSSSLVATHLACESLQRGECELALAGGVTVMLSPATMVAMSKGQFLARDGRSKTFDASADGYGRGEGAAVVVLKRLDAALRDRNRVYAVIAASGVNQDGRTDGIAMPSEVAQRELCARVLQMSGLAAADIEYVEAHGTGTRVGDRIETAALGAIYGQARVRPLAIGSIKTNIGHLEAAAGVTGLIKAALSVQRRQIYPMRHLDTLNPDIPFETLNLRPAVCMEPWPVTGLASAAVNSFGYGGTNAHVVLHEAPAAKMSPTEMPVESAAAHALCLVPLSAANRGTLLAHAAQLADTVDESRWLDQAYTLARHRVHMPERAVVLADSAASLRAGLRNIANDEPTASIAVGRASVERRLCWVFTGMGPQWWGMGRELYGAEPVFRKAVEDADRAFEHAAHFSILEELLRDEKHSRMPSNEIAQPANFIIQVGLTTLLRSLGVPQHGILGHSVGEVAAAWAAGCLSLQQAAFLTYHRSRLQQKVAGRGTMLSAAISPQTARELLVSRPNVVIAAYNAPNSVALAGEAEELQSIAMQLTALGVFHRMMPVEVAYHSPQMDPLADQFREVLRPLSPKAPEVALYSTLLGARVENACHDAEYFWQNARQPVQLQSALESACADGYTAFLEIGPHPVLSPAIREVVGHEGREGRSTHCLKRSQPEVQTFYRGLADLHSFGVALDWQRIHPCGRFSNLPKYPFQRENHWAESQASHDERVGLAHASRFFSQREAGSMNRFTSDLARPSLQYLWDHRIQGTAVFPGAAYLEAVFCACVERDAGRAEYVIEDIELERAFVLRADAAPALALELGADRRFAIHARHESHPWERYARGRAVLDAHYGDMPVLDVEAIRATMNEPLDLAETYQRFTRLGLEYGSEFRRLVELRVARTANDGAMLARLNAKDLAGEPGCLHPTLLDSAFQALLAAVPELQDAMVPVSVDLVRWRPGSRAPAWAHGHATRQPNGSLTADLLLADDAGNVFFEARGLVCQKLERGVASAQARWLHIDGWQEHAWPSLGDTDDDKAQWVLLGNAHGFLSSLADALQSVGLSASHTNDTHDSLPIANGSRVVLALDSDDEDPVGIRLCARALSIFKALPARCSLRVVTFGAYGIDGCDLPQPSQTALWGLGRVLMTERPELDCRLLDHARDGASNMLRLATLLKHPQAEEETAVRGNKLYVRRLQRIAPSGQLEDATITVAARDHFGAYELPVRSSAESPDVAFIAQPLRAPEPDEVQVEVQLAELQSADHATRSDRNGHPFEQRPLRSYIGQVLEVGERVKGVRIGDRVHAIDRARPASHLTLNSARVFCLPAWANNSAVAYRELMLAWYALCECGSLQSGDTVLIHGAASTFGSACARVARSQNARVVATVDPHEHYQEHCDALRSLGVETVYCSANFDFVDALRCAGLAAGAQLVVNTLDDPGRTKCFELLSAGGRFVDLSPMSDGDVLDLRRLRRGVSYCRVDFESFMNEQPEKFGCLRQQVLAAIVDEKLPEPEVACFPGSSVQEALQELASGALKTIALDLADGSAQVSLDPAREPMFRIDRSYLVTGGLAGLGLATAEWLVERGAGCIVLGARRFRPDREASAAIERMKRSGARVECRQLDVTKSNSIDEVINFIREELPPLAGVFHSAMVLEDGPIRTLGFESLERVMAPKAAGAWLLYSKTEQDELDYFVMYSSVSALVGNPNQASYAAANAFLDGLVELGRSRGRAVSCVSFGAIGDTGVVARDAATQAHLHSLGFAPIPAKLALAALGWTLREGLSRVGIIDANWDKWTKSFPDTPWRRLQELAGANDESDTPGLVRLRAEIEGLDAQARFTTIRRALLTVAAQVFHLNPDRIDPGMSLKAYGLDSLMAIELQSALEQNTGIVFPAIQLLAGASIDELTARALTFLEAPRVEVVSPGPRVPDNIVDLREYFLSRICVQPPYFDLFDIERDGEWVSASVRPVPPSEDEADIVSCAEAARHLAIVGSCALSLQCPVAGKVYYPVERAHHPNMRGALDEVDAAELEIVRVRARCVSFDLKASRASAETELTDSTGRLVYRLIVDYHVIPEADFQRMFVKHTEPTQEHAISDPYAVWRPLPACAEKNGTFSCDLGPVEAAACVGHFASYPAMPVSIMTRYAIQLIAEAFRLRSGRSGARIRIINGSAATKMFAFAGASVSLVARRLPSETVRSNEVWSCDVQSGGQVAASFEFEIEAHWPRVSGIQLTKPIRLSA